MVAGGGGGVGFAPGPIGLVGLGGGGGHGGMFGLGDHDGLQHAGDDDELGDDLDGEMEMDENLDDEHLDGAGAPAGLEALAGMEAIGGAEVEVERGVGEAGMVGARTRHEAGPAAAAVHQSRRDRLPRTAATVLGLGLS